MYSPTILLVEDDSVVADTLKRKLEHADFRVVGSVTSYEAAVNALSARLPDAVLLDIELDGERTGIDLGHHLRRLPDPPPFIYLTGCTDDHYLAQARQTKPKAFFSKPLPYESLINTLRTIDFPEERASAPGATISVLRNGRPVDLPVNHIAYVRADHVYVELICTDGKSYLLRKNLKNVLVGDLHDHRFVRVHRSYAVNRHHVAKRDGGHLLVGKTRVPVSREKRKAIFRHLGV